MAYDEHLAEELRDALRGRGGITEKRMFGGLCWLMHGNMLCVLGREGRYMFRVGEAQEAAALERPGAEEMVMSKRRMNGFVWVDADAALDEGLGSWLDLAAAYVGGLPPK